MASKKETSTKKPAKKTAKKRSPKVKPELKDFLNEIKKRSYELYLERKNNGMPGNEISDWLKAEQEIKVKYNL